MLILFTDFLVVASLAVGSFTFWHQLKSTRDPFTSTLWGAGAGLCWIPAVFLLLCALVTERLWRWMD